MSVGNPTASLRPWVVIVGGFLGAGKTTLILAAAQELERRGLRSAVILNDQGESLVDTRLAAVNGVQAGEVTGGCFCCRLSELVREIDRLRAYAPDVIFAEPVGSCTDLSATIFQPLREYSDVFRLAPFTVLVDPSRAEMLLREDADANLSFLFRKQLKEADLVCFTKSDLYPTYPAIDAHPIRQVSATTRQGLAAWLDETLSGALTAGAEILDIDYEQYARAEAALAWLNLHTTFESRVAISPAMMLGPFLNCLDAEYTAANILIVHLKVIVNSPGGFLKAAVCANGQEPSIQGNLDASPASKHEVTLNLRALGPAERVRQILEQELERLDGQFTGLRIDCFSPAAPEPERRMLKSTVNRFS